ncbi:MAG: signal peptidase I [Planctomycetales bacterium 4484_123]|nr:MAG: signal peptidase I [Planctomycetales bacterium 4484_123]
MAKDVKSSDEQLRSVRETVESVWIAIVVAFVLRAFVLEAFMIPTGSMAPRLMGRHTEFDCPACGHHYAYGAGAGKNARLPRVLNVSGARCPNCGHVRRRCGEPTFGGDRVLVLKYLYRFREPRPWDVVVFKNPLNNRENYIKRLIGLPGQQVQIVHGDVFVRAGKDFDGNDVIDAQDFANPRMRTDPDCRWRILTKPPRTQEVMWQVIFDNDFQPDPAVWSGPGRWHSPWRQRAGQGGWDLTVQAGRVFRFSGAAAPAEVEFAADAERFYPNYAYNPPGKTPQDFNDLNYDLKLSFRFVPRQRAARVGLHLSSLRNHFRAWLGADGRAVLEHALAGRDGAVAWKPKVWATNTLGPLRLGRGYEVALTHVDRRVTLWVDGRAVLRTTAKQYPADRQRIIRAVREMLQSRPEGLPAPTVRILGQGGPFELSHIKLMRDVYYTSPNVYAAGDTVTPRPGWGTADNPMVLRKFFSAPDLDEFYVLGDNSPASKDSRMWGYHAPTLRGSELACRLNRRAHGEYAFLVAGKYKYRYRNGTVPRYNLIGKAFFVYWPGGYRLLVLRGLPIVPNVGRMRLIR